jgi:hypothetical protein
MASSPINYAPLSVTTSAMISLSRTSIRPPITLRRYFEHHVIHALKRNIRVRPQRNTHNRQKQTAHKHSGHVKHDTDAHTPKVTRPQGERQGRRLDVAPVPLTPGHHTLFGTR